MTEFFIKAILWKILLKGFVFQETLYHASGIIALKAFDGAKLSKDAAGVDRANTRYEGQYLVLRGIESHRRELNEKLYKKWIL